MPQGQLTNVLGADGLGYNTGPVVQDVANTSAGALPFGSLVALQTIVQATTTQFLVALATTTAGTAPLNIGIVISGGQNSGVGSSIPASGNGQIVIHGHTRALFDSATSPTVKGHYAIISATAGALLDSGGTTAAAGVDYGAVLEAVTIASGTALVNIWFEKS